jgi:peptide deformylase
MKITQKNLYTVCKPIDFTNKSALLFLSNQMFDFMEKQGGIGLAANQIGQIKRMFVMNVHGRKVCVNPEVINEGNPETGYEGCLSFKGEFISVDRPTDIRVKYQTWDGFVIEENLLGIEARCFLHELDHLNGITMYKRKLINESIGNA